MTKTSRPLEERLQEMLQVAAQEANTAAGGAALCKVSATGIQGQSVKYFEGRWAALRDVERGIRAGKDPVAIRAEWTAEYARHTTQDSGPAWVHYSAGGVDALSELLDC